MTHVAGKPADCHIIDGLLPLEPVITRVPSQGFPSEVVPSTFAGSPQQGVSPKGVASFGLGSKTLFTLPLVRNGFLRTLPVLSSILTVCSSSRKIFDILIVPESVPQLGITTVIPSPLSLPTHFHARLDRTLSRIGMSSPSFATDSLAISEREPYASQ